MKLRKLGKIEKYQLRVLFIAKSSYCRKQKQIKTVS